MYARATTNPRLTQYQRDRNLVAPEAVDVQAFEAIAEFVYRARLARWLIARPNLQCVVRPGGAGRITDAFVIGLYMQATF